ncbi:MAG: ion transporter [Rhizobiaceae bacterium]
MNEIWQKKTYAYLEGENRDSKLGHFIDLFLIILIAVNVVSVILETVDWIHDPHETLFNFIEVFSVLVFTIEYFVRFWVSADLEKYKDLKYPRLRYVFSPMAVIDLVAILPFYLTFFFTIDLRFLRVLRLLRIFKLTRYSSAMTMMLDVLREESRAFLAGFFILGVLLVLAASGAYLVEHGAQPDKFSSIPSAMWWAIATLTTVGYGDVTPITSAGKLFGAMVAVIGIGMAALPAGILASGMADQLRHRRELMEEQFRLALQDGLADEEEQKRCEALRKKLGLSVRHTQQILKDVRNELANRSVTTCPNCGKKLS